jgi:hypothetical protein
MHEQFPEGRADQPIPEIYLEEDELRSASRYKNVPPRPGNPHPYICLIVARNTGGPSMGDPDGTNTDAFDNRMSLNGFHYGQDGVAPNCYLWERIADPFPWQAGPPPAPPPLLANIVQATVTPPAPFLPPDLIIVTGSQIARAVVERTSTIPVILATDDGSCVQAGLAASLANPGGNVTGMTSRCSFLTGDRLTHLANRWGGAANISPLGILWNPDVLDKQTDWDDLEPVAVSLGVALLNNRADPRGQIRQIGDVVPAVNQLKADGAAAIMTFSDALTFRTRNQIIARLNAAPALTRASFETSRFLGGGHAGFQSYGPRMQWLYAGAADYVLSLWDWTTMGVVPPPVPAINTVPPYLKNNP